MERRGRYLSHDSIRAQFNFVSKIEQHIKMITKKPADLDRALNQAKFI